MHKGENYVVIGSCRIYLPTGNWCEGWRITPVELAEAGIVICRQSIPDGAEVEMFFPGPVFPLSEFII